MLRNDWTGLSLGVQLVLVVIGAQQMLDLPLKGIVELGITGTKVFFNTSQIHRTYSWHVLYQ